MDNTAISGRSDSLGWHLHVARLLLSALIMIALCGSTMATTSVPLPKISIGVSSGVGIETFQAIPHLSPYAFDASIDIPGGIPGKGDLYFSVITPGFEHVLTWISSNGAPAVSTAFVPIARGIDLNTASTISIASMLGQDIYYTFNGMETPGTYWIFALLVASDSPPTDELRWYAVNMRPLVFRP